MTEYVPYTIDVKHRGNYDINNDNNHRVVTDLLEQARKAIFELKEKNLYSSELHQATLLIENALLYSNHYYDRREKLGIYHLPIPEDITPVFEYLSKLPQKNIIVRFYFDNDTEPHLMSEFDLGSTFIQKELPIIFVLLEYCMRGSSPKYYIVDETPDTLTLGFLVDHNAGLFDVSYNNLEYIRGCIAEIESPNSDIAKGFNVLTFYNLYDNTEFKYTLSEEQKPYFSMFTSTANANRMRFLTIEISEFFRNELNLTVIGEPTKPGLFMFISNGPNSDIENKLREFIDNKIQELINRHFV